MWIFPRSSVFLEVDLTPTRSVYAGRMIPGKRELSRVISALVYTVILQIGCEWVRRRNLPNSKLSTLDSYEVSVLIVSQKVNIVRPTTV